VTGLEVDGERMRANLEASGGLVLAERVSFALTPRLGRSQAHAVVAEAARSSSFRQALAADAHVDLAADELDTLLDPEGYLGTAEALVDRALHAYEATR
jgi:3-carboxy-cis,cis-muconate cycloisomerase